MSDGRTFWIVKVFYHPGLLAERVRRIGFEVAAERMDTIFYLRGTRSALYRGEWEGARRPL